MGNKEILQKLENLAAYLDKSMNETYGDGSNKNYTYEQYSKDLEIVLGIRMAKNYLRTCFEKE